MKKDHERGASREKHRRVNKVATAQPREEILDDPGGSSHSDASNDREHGAEVEAARMHHAGGESSGT